MNHLNNLQQQSHVFLNTFNQFIECETKYKPNNKTHTEENIFKKLESVSVGQYNILHRLLLLLMVLIRPLFSLLRSLLFQNMAQVFICIPSNSFVLFINNFSKFWRDKDRTVEIFLNFKSHLLTGTRESIEVEFQRILGFYMRGHVL